MTISPELEQITKTCTETQKTPNSRTTLRKKNKAMKSHNSLISHQLQSYSNQNNMVLAPNRHMYQWSAQSPETNPHL